MHGMSLDLLHAGGSPVDFEVGLVFLRKLSLTGRAEAAGGRVSGLMSEWVLYGGRVETRS